MSKYCGKAVFRMGTSNGFVRRFLKVNNLAVLNPGVIQGLYGTSSSTYYTPKYSIINLLMSYLSALYTGLITKTTIYLNTLTSNSLGTV